MHKVSESGGFRREGPEEQNWISEVDKAQNQSRSSLTVAVRDVRQPKTASLSL